MFKSGTYRTAWLGVLLVYLLTGCGGMRKIPLSEVDRTNLKSNPGIRAVHRELPQLTITTAGRAVINDLTLGTAGGQKDFAKEYGIPDPAVAIKESLALAMEQQGGFKKLVMRLEPLPRPNADTGDVLNTTYKSGVILDVMTVNWSGIYFATDWTHYWLGYLIQGRLVWMEDKKVLWSGFCSYNSEKDGGLKASMDELTANNGALFKKIYADAGKYCGDQLLRQFFNRES